MENFNIKAHYINTRERYETAEINAQILDIEEQIQTILKAAAPEAEQEEIDTLSGTLETLCEVRGYLVAQMETEDEKRRSAEFLRLYGGK